MQSLLEESTQYWKRYNACVDLFHVWLNDAEQMLQKSPEERGVSVVQKARGNNHYNKNNNDYGKLQQTITIITTRTTTKGQHLEQ